jgi:hypothetical protein
MNSDYLVNIIVFITGAQCFLFGEATRFLDVADERPSFRESNGMPADSRTKISSMLHLILRLIDLYVLHYLYYKNSVALVRKQTIPTERPPLVCEVNANVLRMEGVAWSAQRFPTAVNLDFIDTEPLLLHSSSPSLILKRLNGPRSRPTTSQKIW